MRQTQLTITGKAISKDNEKVFNRKGRPYLSKKYRLWERQVALQAVAQMGCQPLYKNPNLLVVLDFYMPNRVHCDLMNLPKSVCDALNGIVWKDDKQIMTAVLGLHYDKANPRIEIIVREK